MKIKTFTLLVLILSLFLLLSSCSGESSKAIRTGDAIAPFAGTDLEGNPFSLAAHAGKPAIVRFFSARLSLLQGGHSGV
jgi:cytochrome oxidase Cu insertion factor (SCO1/SenC/PrrC family)